jgi:hypothetical protein
MFTLNDVIFALLGLEVVLILALLVPPPLDFVSRALASVLTIDSPTSFLNRYGSFVAGNLGLLIIWVLLSIYNTYAKLTDAKQLDSSMKSSGYLVARHDLFLHASVLYLLVVLVGVVALWKRTIAMEMRASKKA